MHWCIAIYTCPLPQPYATVDSEAATGTWHHVASHGTREALLPFCPQHEEFLTVLSGSFAQKVGGSLGVGISKIDWTNSKGRSSTEAWKCRDGGETHTCTDDKSERVILYTSKERFHFANTLSLSSTWRYTPAWPVCSPSSVHAVRALDLKRSSYMYHYNYCNPDRPILSKCR